ncbi:MAG: hypothetical protein CMLOHMNK_02795 [Steroidobacteraceae bacterium]|nr:hypothetical protein [Steroidobacteraceae bacterium]
MSSIRLARRAATALGLLALAACGSVEIAPEPILPKPVVRPLPVKAAVLLPGDQRAFRHTETRGGVDWLVELGAGHQRLAREVFGALFSDVRFFDDAEAARAATDLAVIFEPRMEQYSFATANETGGGYYAVTISYRINVYAPGLRLVDSYTLTGYGNSRNRAMSSSEPLEAATRAAMRDAAAKFLVQFPQQPIGQQLARGEPLVAPAVAATTGDSNKASAARLIEAVPVLETAGAPRPVAPPATAPAENPPPPAPQAPADPPQKFTADAATP